jgi:predicted RecB family nuclease
MNPSVPLTAETFAAFLKCRYKAYLKLKGEAGETSDYLRTQADLSRRYQAVVREALLKQAGGAVESPPRLADAVRSGVVLIMDATVADGGLSCHIDALEKEDGESPRYRPVLFFHREKVTADDRLLLAFEASVLGRVQGQTPRRGRIIHGRTLQSRRVELASLAAPVEGVVGQLRELASAAKPPRLVLNSHCAECEFRQRCHAEAIDKDDLSLLGGLSTKEITKLNARGIYSVAQYSHTFRPRKARKDGPAGARPRLPLSLQALAIREGTVYAAEKPTLPAASVQAFLDVEGLPDEGFHYLIGLVVRDGDARREFSFWADRRQDEAGIWASFLQAIDSLGDFALFHYGSYETDFVRKMSRAYGGDPELLRRIEARSINVLSLIYSRVFFPVHSNDLKSIAACLGFRWSAEDASGLQAVAWRRDWEATAADTFKQQLVSYNQEDCLALERLVTFLASVGREDAARAGPAVAAVEDVRQGSPGNFGRKQYFFPALARITKCSYFDYQRERILFRTSPLLKKYARTRECGHLRKRGE